MKNKYFLILFYILIQVSNLYAERYPGDDFDCNGDYWVNKVELSKNKIIAKSFLPETGGYVYYPDNLLDHNKNTCWCPNGNGILDFVMLKIPKNTKGFRIINGVSKSKELFYQNNRVKRIYWALITENNYKSGGEEINDICRVAKPNINLKYCVAYQTAREKIFLKDTMDSQNVYFSDDRYFHWDTYLLKNTKSVYLVIYIVDIYKGSKYNDTCISEIEIIK